MKTNKRVSGQRNAPPEALFVGFIALRSVSHCVVGGTDELVFFQTGSVYNKVRT